MSKKKDWASFEDRVREIAGYIWGRPCVPKRIAGVNLDGVTVLDGELYFFVEITTERNLAKIRDDITKLAAAKSAAFNKGILARCFCILENTPTQAMFELAEQHNIRVMCLDDFRKQFFDFETYFFTRSLAPFGSAINPVTGETDKTDYVPVRYLVEGKHSDISSKEIANFLRQGKNVILLGEYGSGKSRCIREVFRDLGQSAIMDFCHPIAIDLRKSWGLRERGEMIRRHFHDLGLDQMEAGAIRALRANSLVFLLDGFDEIGSQAWSNDGDKLRLIRSKSLEGVKDIVRHNGGGTLVAGREHYFSDVSELFNALGMDPKSVVVVRSKSEFSDTELLEYFHKRNISVDVPPWLPRRPLICQTISDLADDQMAEMFGEEGNEISFWNHFIDILCKRDANINISFDPETIMRIFVRLARLTRIKGANVGPISLAELQSAFEFATGAAPIEEASIMLQRLPSLGRVGVESNDRQFVDLYILDGLRAKDISRINLHNDADVMAAGISNWLNPLEDLGQRVLANDMTLSEAGKLYLSKEALKFGNTILASDLVGALLRENERSFDFEGIEIEGGYFSLLPLDERGISNLKITHSIFNEIALPVKSATNIQIEDSSADRVTGVSAATALPPWIRRMKAANYDSVANVSRIKKIGLKPSQEIFTTIVRKTFFQKGAGRKEEALLRGLGKIAAKSLSNKILNMMEREGLLSTHAGDEGKIYSPDRSQTARMQKVLDELTSSADPIWEQISDLK